METVASQMTVEQMTPSGQVLEQTDVVWRICLPVLTTGDQVVMREVRASDAAPLFAALTAPEVARFISPPPATVQEFEHFIAWNIRQRETGAGACFAVTLKGFDTAIGIFQVRSLDADFRTAEWGFALGSAFWGTGVFRASAELVLQFIFTTLGVHRLEARSMVQNGRGNRAVQKVGGVQEGVLRKAFFRDGKYHDQVLHSIMADDWQASRRRAGPVRYARVH